MAVQVAAQEFNKFEKIEKLAPEVQAVLLGARVEAGDKRYETTHTVHFLTALLQSDEFEIADLLREKGLTVEYMRGGALQASHEKEAVAMPSAVEAAFFCPDQSGSSTCRRARLC